MSLFDAYHMSMADAEKALVRPLRGNPSEGEIAVLMALNDDRIEDAIRHLGEDGHIQADFRELIEKHMQGAVERSRTTKFWNVRLPMNVFHHYSAQARRENRSIAECLESAILRDYEHGKQASNPIEALEENVRRYMAAVGQLMEEVKQTKASMGSVADLTLRLQRIEAALNIQRPALAVPARR